VIARLQESHAYFFCLEDRALLCRSCDVAVHTANAFVSAHRRFLLTGVQVGQEQDEHSPDPPEPSPPPPPPPPASKSDHPAPLYGEGGGGFSWDAADSPAAGGLPDWSAVVDQFGSPPPPRHTDTATVTTPPPTKRSPRAPAFGGQGGMMDWPLGEFFGGFTDFTGGFGFGFGDSGTSKVTTPFSSSPRQISLNFPTFQTQFDRFLPRIAITTTNRHNIYNFFSKKNKELLDTISISKFWPDTIFFLKFSQYILFKLRRCIHHCTRNITITPQPL
jgi:hypothetical protein